MAFIPIFALHFARKTEFFNINFAPMQRKLLLLFIFVIFGTVFLQAQTGSIKVKLVDKKTHDPMPFANVVVEQGGVKVVGNQTNFDGEIYFSALPPGKYDVKASFIGYQTIQKTGVLILVDATQYLQFDMEDLGGVQMKEVQVVAAAVELISKGISTEKTVTREDWNEIATKDVNTVVATGAGIFQADRGQAINMRGARGDATSYFVDGVQVPAGSALGIAQQGIEQITTISGGLPAQYGNALGGVIAITTRGVQPNFFATVGAETSEYLDAFGENMGQFSIGSPIYQKRDTAGHKKAVVGFILSGDFTHDKDPSPSPVGAYAVNASTLNGLNANPLMVSPEGGSNVYSAAYINPGNIYQIPYRPDVAATGINLNGKLKFAISDNTDLTIGGRYGYGNSQASVYQFELFNPSQNPQTIGSSFNINARLVARFNTRTEDDKSKTSSLITNEVFTIQGEWTRDKSTVQDENYGANIFNYGYIGKFDIITGKQNYFYDEGNNQGQYVSNYAWDPTKRALVQQGLPGDSLVLFTPGTANPNASAYTSDFYSLRNGNPVHDFNEIQTGLGLLNGDAPQNLYSTWYNTGTVYNGYAKTNNDQIRFYTNFAASIKNHNIQAGFDFAQSIQSSYSLAPQGLWTLMRQLANSHLSQMDLANPIYSKEGLYNVISYNPRVDSAAQTQFDKSLRAKLGLGQYSNTIINTDGLNPSFYSLNMFSPDNLLNQGSALVSYNGYDYTGNKLSGSANDPSFTGYFTNKDAAGNYTREAGAFEPIYISGYVQDQFDIQDLKVRLGLRLESYDANQEVMKDPFSLYAIKTVGEVTGLGAAPSNIPSNYVVYVNNPTDPTQIIGYRNPNSSIAAPQWFTPQGVLVNNPTVLSNNAGVSQLYPYLVNPNSNSTTISTDGAFKNYSPAINLMPRIAFAFPISDLAKFQANYDIVTQAPTLGTNYANPFQYLSWAYSAQSPFLTNPGLLPQQTTNYEIGYNQYLSDRKNSAITITVFYKELRNMEDVVGVVDAYPSQYTTYGSIDFATVKGGSVIYEMRRTKNFRMTANYTLQFADGTGSSAADGINLVNAGLPNLRTLIPLSYDRRHTFNVVADYRYGNRTDYNGPIWIMHKGKEGEKIIKILEDVGFNLTATAGSGTPYSRQANVTEAAAFGIQFRSALEGSPNGSNLPWAYRLDFKVDKSMMVTWKPEKDGKAAKKGRLNVYVRVLNLLNTQNVLAVYRYTGNPNDDGFLSSPAGQQYVAAQNSPSAFTSLYKIAVNYPGNYSIPRSIMVGFIMDI